ncbi:MAG: hypothetical protein IPN29_15015 [Saprospiraceae bacterium]|nr:hypothetical protein [Saprospiraceae bacterium]
MKLIRIPNEREPVCLIELRKVTNDYSHLQGDCMLETKSTLSTLQMDSCAYCERKLNSVFIEHYIPRSAGTGLEFDNLLAVCSGNYYIDKLKGDKIDHCDTKKGNTRLSLDPRNQCHIDTLTYTEDATLISTHLQFQHDIDVNLNLNFYELKRERQDAFNEVDLEYIVGEAYRNFPLKERLQRLIIMAERGEFEFSAYIKFRVVARLSYIIDSEKQ